MRRPTGCKHALHDLLVGAGLRPAQVNQARFAGGSETRPYHSL